MGMIRYFDDISEISYLNRLPDYCPICKKSVIPDYILLHINGECNELLCRCPNSECNSLFFTVYTENPFKEGYYLEHYYPQSRNFKEFPEIITELTPEFVIIYNQSLHAEKEGLDLICGVGYRKSLEYLVKDYIISEYPDDADKVKAIHSITKCIYDYIDDSDIREMSERATWLGNDETHYVRKWESKDIQDLKNLIDLTVYFISMKIKAKKYKEDMIKR